MIVSIELKPSVNADRDWAAAGQFEQPALRRRSSLQPKGSEEPSKHGQNGFEQWLLESPAMGETVEPPAFEDVSCPLFVTWNKLSRRGTYRLRGCIGTLEAKQLHQALRDYALTSALGDRRFAPVEQTEIASLKCTVSLLRCFQQAATWLDWTIGQHGLIIEFMDPLAACKRTATFLPEIPQQEGWSQQQTIDSLISKVHADT
ncbi:hypothetical protein WJX84_006407 [Apatococcus fuscideae]|uniref:AMMECR1 domain-containing protein n=1 Tax=Apatococcus fuscideae TaxID=2026836 RepID=A0AAW1TA12_9CHLO